VIGPILFHQNALTYVSWVLVVLTLFYLYRTRPGLHLRAVGESPATADAMGVNVTAYRYVHVMIGGALAGIGGAFFSLAITPGWLDGMTPVAGRVSRGMASRMYSAPEPSVQITPTSSAQTEIVNGPSGLNSQLPGAAWPLSHPPIRASPSSKTSRRATMVIKVFALPQPPAGITTPSAAAKLRSPVTRNSRAMMTAAIQPGMR